MYLRNISQHIEEEAQKIDLSKIHNKAAALTRLFEDAENALLKILAFTTKAGVSLANDQVVAAAIHSLMPDQNGKRVLKTMWNGQLIDMPLEKLDSQDAARHEIAELYDVMAQDVLRYEKAILDSQYGKGLVQIHCNHPGCIMTKSIYFADPAEMLSAERHALQELWYCHHHRETAYKNEGAISDYFLPFLKRIQKSPGLNQKDTGAKRDDIFFLEGVGLVRVERLCQGSRVLMYQIYLTDRGRASIAKLVDRIDQKKT